MCKANFSFMGFDESEVLGASLRDEKAAAENLGKLQERIKQVVAKWY
jgi:hypothetical protein